MPKNNRPNTQALFYSWVINISHSLLKYISVLSMNLSPGEKLNRDTHQHQHDSEESKACSNPSICLFICCLSVSLFLRNLVRYRLGRWQTEDTQMMVSGITSAQPWGVNKEMFVMTAAGASQEPLRGHRSLPNFLMPHSTWCKHTFDQ